METLARLAHLIRFGAFELDLHTQELRKHGLKLKLHGQPIEVLAMLLERPGELVTREELHKKLWPEDTFVDFEHGINAVVNRLREAPGDDAETPRYVETLPRRGYRFIAPVETVGADGVRPLEKPVTGEGTSRVPLRRRWTIAALVAGALMASVAVPLALNVAGLRDRLAPIVGASVSRRMPLPKIESIAVLPLENLSHDPEQEYFADGMTEALITDLGKISALRVISRTSVMHYKGTAKTLPEIARELNVDAVVEGAVMRSGDRVRITAQLIQAATDKHLWAETYERDLRDVLALQGEVAQAIAREVQVKLTPQEQARLTRARPVNPEAYQLYSRARSIMNRYQGPTEAMVKYLEEAIAKDPKFALAQADLGVVYLASGRRAEAASAILKALELDDTLSEAHTAMADLKFGDWEWSECERESRRAIELNPSNVDAHHDYSHFLQAMGRFPESLTECLRALELNPLSVPMNCHLGEHYVAARQYDQAIAQLRKALELEPNFPQAHYFLGAAYLAKGMLSEAVEEDLRAAVLWGKSAEDVTALRKAFASSGLKGYRQKQLELAKAQWQKSRDNEFDLASLHAALGQKELALGWLQKAVEKRHVDVPDLRTDPSFDPLRSDPRFQDLLRRMNFPPYEQ
jgi:TolB-like protein/DNA-binding winged helix-turn-helix (wHTH) protein/Tfp pilus assembly protein PilF